jgi:hypothetical protein
LFPDIIAMMDGTARTLRDLLASFPIVRRIEAEVLALDLDRITDAIPGIREQMAAIKAAVREIRGCHRRGYRCSHAKRCIEQFSPGHPTEPAPYPRSLEVYGKLGL